MSIFYSTPARNPLVPEIQLDVSRLTPAQLASFAASGRALHAAGIRAKRRDFTTWQSAEPAGWDTNNPTDAACAAVGLDAVLGLAWYCYVIPDAVGLRDLAPLGVQALDDNYLTDGADRWVVLAHGLDPDEDLKIGEVGDCEIKTSFEILAGDVMCAPTVGCTFVGTGSYSRWLSRHSDAQEWELLTSKPAAADIIAAWDPSEVLLDHFAVTPDGAQLKAKNDRIACIRMRRADLPDDWRDQISTPLECGAPLILIGPSFVTVYLELARSVLGTPYGARLVDFPECFRQANGAPPPMTVARADGKRVHLDPIPGLAGVYGYLGGGVPIRCLDRGVDARGVQLVGWPPAPLPTPIS